MKIVHSLWTLPHRQQGFHKFEGGWADRRYNYMSQALSCLQFRQYYDQVELVTDSYGAWLLGDALRLPYTRVQVALDSLAPYHPDLWALGKTVAYGMQQEPFIHADGDIFIYRRLPEHIENAPLVAQHLEVDFPYYYPIMDAVSQHFQYLPHAVRAHRQAHRTIRAHSAGLFGGHDLAFMQEYSREVFRFIDRNQSHLHHVRINHLNVVFDQYIHYCMAWQQQKEVTFFAGEVTHRFGGFTDFKSIPRRAWYLHPVDLFKKNVIRCEAVEARLRRDYPDYYYRIRQLLQDGKI